MQSSTPTRQPPILVWFKRDLRLSDHEPLFEAAQRGPCICLYIYEPEVVADNATHAPDVEFINGCLRDLDDSLRQLGGSLITRRGRAVEVLERLQAQTGFRRIFSHQETGNAKTYARDLAVKKWAKTRRIEWRETRQQGVFRGLRDRDGWAALWERDMRSTMAPLPATLDCPAGIESEGILSPTALGMEVNSRTQMQVPGERAAQAALHSFLFERGETYQSAMSSPLEGSDACSRLSPYIAYGAISVRNVYQNYLQRIVSVRELQRQGVGGLNQWARSLSSFNKRLHWNGHFIQRLESDPSIEHHNLVRAFDGLRNETPNEAYLEAWKTGHTGYPMVDACMRFLNATGWLNFRMRAMVVSFASYHLWLPWQLTGKYLARQFLDYEPGIHYNQLQMQSGVTGINAVRIYSPTKQVTDQDPEGVFIRRWVPELEDVPNRCIAEPHTMDMIEQAQTSFRIGSSYPLPVVDHGQAVRAAKDRIYEIRRTPVAKSQAQEVLRRHGSRRKRTKPRRRSGERKSSS